MIDRFFRKEKLQLNTGLITKALQMSKILLDGDSVLASKVVLEAVNLTDTYHPKRRYYKLKVHDYRNKILFDKDMLLQYFIYKIAQRYEMEQEQEYLAGKRLLHEQTMIMRYIKHLLLLSTENRSFSVTVGLCRLLYDYKHLHTSKIYETLIQYAGPQKADEQYRKCRLTLMDKLTIRFRNFLTVREGPKQKKGFRLYEDQGRIAHYVKQSLDFFTPWMSSCVLPAVTAGPMPTITPLIFSGSHPKPHPDEEYPIEKARMHTLIHPICFSQLIEALGYSSPDEKLAMPQISITDNPMPPDDLNNPPVPTTEEVNYLTDAILQQQYNRQHSSSKELIIFVDGIQRESINLEKTDSAQIELGEDDDLVQVFSKEKDGNILLSTSSMGLNSIMGYDDCWVSCMKLEGGQKIGIGLTTHPANNTSDTHTRTMEITYSEIISARAAYLWLRRLKYKMSQLSLNNNLQDFIWTQILVRLLRSNKTVKQLIISPNTLYKEKIMKALMSILILGSLLSTGLLTSSSEKPALLVPAIAMEKVARPTFPVSVGDVLHAHNVPQNPDALLAYDGEAVRLTLRPRGIDHEIPSFFERHVSVVWAGNAYKRYTADPLKLREQFDLFDGSVPYRAVTEKGILTEEANPMGYSQAKGLEFGVKTFGLVPVLKQLSEPATEVIYSGRTAYGQDKFDIKMATGKWTLYADTEHLISRIEVGDKVIEYAGYRSVDGVRLPFIQRMSIGGQLVQELIFTRISLNPKLDSNYFRRETLSKQIAR